MNNTRDNEAEPPFRPGRALHVGANVGGVAARIAGARLFGLEGAKGQNAADLAAALGGLKGPIMKVAQLLSTIPEALPAEYAQELSQLQSQAPAMGLGVCETPHGRGTGTGLAEQIRAVRAGGGGFGVARPGAPRHRARRRAARLQIAVPGHGIGGGGRRHPARRHLCHPPADEPGGGHGGNSRGSVGALARGTRLPPGGQAHGPLPAMFADGGMGLVRVPDVRPELSTRRLLTMQWLDGTRVTDHKAAPLEHRNSIARAMFQAWWFPFSHYGVIHGDPHLGNYSVFLDGPDGDGSPGGINLLDYGCIRTFAPKFVGGVVDLYRGLERDDRALIVHAYETWGFKGLSNELIDLLNIWARFIYGPLLDDRERTIAEDTTPGEYGRREAFKVHQGLKEKGPVRVPREFVFMDRAAIGLGGVFLHLDARQNWYRLFNETIDGFAARPSRGEARCAALERAGVPKGI